MLTDGGYVAGLFFACITVRPTERRAEYHQTGIRFYTHTQFSSGIEQDGIILAIRSATRGSAPT